MADGPIRILIVEDHPLMVDALIERLRRDAAMEVVGVAGSAPECLSLYQQTQPDLVLCDVGLSNNSSGIVLTGTLLGAHPRARVLMYSGYVDGELVQAAIEAGAVGYIRKTASIPELIECCTAAARGQTDVFDRTTLSEMLGDLRRKVAAPAGDRAKLTKREHQVLTLMVEGTTVTKDIAAELFIAPETAKSHVEKIMTKLNVNTRTAAVAKAYQEGLVGEGPSHPLLPPRS